MSDFQLLRFRAGEGVENDIANAILDALTNDSSVVDGVVEVVLDAAIERYSDKLTAALRRAGVEIEDGAVMDVETITELVSRFSGFEIEDLSADGIIAAVDAKLVERLQAALGVTVSTVINTDVLLSDLEAAAVEAFESGAGGLVSRAMYARARAAATWARAGYGQGERKAVQNALNQRRYRKSNVEVWD